MPFRIRFPNGQDIPIATLNAEAANLWGIGIARDEVKYVSPNYSVDPDDNNNLSNWYVMIGEAIENPVLLQSRRRLSSSWDDVKETLFNNQLKGSEIWSRNTEHTMDIISGTLPYLKNYFELIDLWKSKGYIPVRIS